MKRLLKRMAAILLAGCICMGITGEVRIALAAVIEETSACCEYEQYGQTVKGGIQLQSDSHSLKEGEIVEVNILYNPDKFNGSMRAFEVSSVYDKDILAYAGVDIKDEHKIEYGAAIYNEKVREATEMGLESLGSEEVYFACEYSRKDFDKSGYIATIKYRLKKDMPFVLIYIAYLGVVAREEDDHKGYEYGFKVNLADSQDTMPKLTFSSTPIQGSGEVTVPISIKQNDGFNLLGMEIDYDTSFFIYETLELNDNLKSKINLDSIYEAPGSGKIKASFIALEDITDVGDFLKLKLKVKDGVLAGTTSNVEVEITQVGNKAETSMSGTGTTCAVSITGTDGGEEQQPTLGDVNADQKIDLVDAVYILQNYNQVREFSKVQETAADVTKDGTVNLVDALMIMKYFNGEIVEF